ncbi:MAG TPA: hypothetical protein VH088_04560, partial [Terriglobales bacterium]|nr:hypothetical protein [Terriglobales bacterium]
IGKIFESSLTMVMLATAVYAIRHLPRYYEQRFGEVEQKSISNKQFIFLLGSLIVLLFIGQRLQWIADGAVRHIHLLLSDPNEQVDIAPFLMWSLFFCLSIRWRMQKTDWPTTGISFIGALAYALLGLHLFSHPDARQFVLWKILNAGAIGIFFITTGLYDHLLLVRSIPNKISEDDNE